MDRLVAIDGMQTSSSRRGLDSQQPVLQNRARIKSAAAARYRSAACHGCIHCTSLRRRTPPEKHAGIALKEKTDPTQKLHYKRPAGKMPNTSFCCTGVYKGECKSAQQQTRR